MEYKEFVDGINDRNGIKQIDFYVKNYPHYHSCSIGRYVDKLGDYEDNGRITCRLTADSEVYSFRGNFDERRKIFDFGVKAGKKTLKEVWDRIVITKTDYWNS